MDEIKTFWIDLETTGLEAGRDYIVEIAALCDGKTFHRYILPEHKPVNYHEIEEFGVKWDFLEQNGINQYQAYIEFIFFLDSIVDKFNRNDKMIIAGKNVSFDVDFLRSWFMGNGNSFFGSYFFNINIDISSVYACLLSKGKVSILNNYKLETLCDYFSVEINAHSAISDIQATKEIYDIMANL
jgi:DNA polymerase-3 subunit epsilon